MMELKLYIHYHSHLQQISPNRTMMELKRGLVPGGAGYNYAPNRTMMELKPVI